MMLVSLLVKASLLLALAAAIHVAIARRTSAASRHLLWTVTLAALLLMPALSAFVPSWTLSIRIPRLLDTAPNQTAAALGVATSVDPRAASVDVPATGSPRATSAPARTAPMALATTPAPAAAALATTPARTATARASTPGFASEPTPATAATSASAWISWRAALLMLYAAGALLLLTRLVAERLTIRRLVRQATDLNDPEWRALFAECVRSLGLERPIRLLRSRDRTMPMTFGTRRPAILLPAIADTWSVDRRRAVLLHELAHVARFDCLTQLMAAVACALYWMHPGVWWVAQRLRVERELACDDRVLVSGTIARDYAGHLLEIAYSLGGGRAPALVVSMARPRHLEGRMLAVLDETRNRTTPALRSRLGAVALAAALLLPLAGAEATVMSAASDQTSQVVQPTPLIDATNDANSATRQTYSVSVVSRLSRLVKARVKTDTGVVAADTGVNVHAAQTAATVAQDRLPGTWEIHPANETGFVHLRITEVSKDGGNWSSGYNIAIDKLQGLSGVQLSSTNGPVTFKISRDAGTFAFEGVLHDSVGAGTFTFAPNPAFPGELVKRGLARPTPEEQYQLARADVGFEYLDELTKQGYQRPDLPDLVRAAQHGVSLDYLRDMGNLGYKVGMLDSLIKMRDHGVTAKYIRDLASDGFTHLSPDELVHLRDHGITPDYMHALRDAGYHSLSLEQTIRARDHGISANYIKEMADLGHGKLPLDEIINVRDHGISAEYIRGMRDAGYPLDDLKTIIYARDHGISVEYIREMAAAGYGKLSLDELIRARDHGISASYAQGMKAQGLDSLSLDDLRRARDHGVGPDFVKGFKDQGYDKIKLDDLIQLRNHGVTPERVRKANERAGTHLPLDLIRSLAGGGGLR